MKITKSEYVVFCDIDYTLIFPKHAIKGYVHTEDMLELPTGNGTRKYAVNLTHLDYIKRLHSRGIIIKLWSGNGFKWCETVAKALEIEHIIDECLTKPHYVIDDKPIESYCKTIFLGKRF